MNFFRKLFGSKPASNPLAPGTPSPSSASAPQVSGLSSQPSDASADAIRVHDVHGREMQISKTDWREKILPGKLAELHDRPDELAALIAQSLGDGFAAEVLPSAIRLASTDTDAERGHVLYAATLLDLRNPTEAEAVLRRFIEKRGETGLILANLAKARAAQGDAAGAADLLWRALALDPNQDQALAWFASYHREKAGETGALDAFRRVAELPDSWRARLWLARHHLEQRDLASALKFYEESLDSSPRPVPADLLQQMSGDLGNHAHLPELLQFAAPYYDVARHGLPTGLNILKAYHDLGQLDSARRFLDRLCAAQRPDWKQPLAFWDAEIAKTRLAIDSAPPPPPRVSASVTPSSASSAASSPPSAPAPGPQASNQLQVTLLAVEGPVWLPPESPAAELFPAKANDAPLVAFLGASAEVPASADQKEQLQLADGPGRLSRALPLYLAEQVELSTPALARILVPWLVKPRPGFILGGVPWDDATASRHARAVVPDDAADYLVITHLRCKEEPWTIELRLVRTIDAACLGTASLACPAADPGQALPALTATLHELLSTHADIAPAAPADGVLSPLVPSLSSDYLLRLEQLLAVRTAGIEPAKSPLNGEREILDGQLRLCLEQPGNLPVRLVFAHTLRAMKRVRPEIVSEFQPRAELLQTDSPLAEPAHSVVSRLFAETFTA